MENIVTRINIDLHSPAVYEVVKAQQNDTNSRIIDIALTNNGDKYPLNEVSTIKFSGHRSDGSSFIQDCTYTDDVITIVLNENILSLHGLHEGRISLYDSANNQILSTPTIKISVQKDPCFDKENVTEAQRNFIDEFIIDIEETVNQEINDLSIEVSKKANKIINIQTGELNEATKFDFDGCNLFFIYYVHDKFIAISDYDIYYSTDGINWNLGNGIDNNSLYSVTYGNGKFVAVGDTYIYYSNDGINWSLGGEIGTGEKMYSVTYGDNKFVAVGNTGDVSNRNGVVYYSTDGINWNLGNIPTTISLSDVTYGNGRFVAVGKVGIYEDDSSVTYYSTDGIHWIGGSAFENPCTLLKVVYGNGKFVAGCGSEYTYCSSDGINWTIVNNSESMFFYTITFGGGMFVAVGVDTETTTSNTYYSTDGFNWNNKTRTETDTINCITYGDNKFVAVGDYGDVYFTTIKTEQRELEDVINTLDETITNKVDKVEGKGLSTNDYTTAEKNKLAGIVEGANAYTHPDSGVTAGTYSNVTVNAQGHVTVGKNYVHAASAGGGTAGYLQIATLTVSGTYQNEPIVIELSRRGAATTCTLYLTFASSADTNPAIGTFVYVGTNYNCYLYKAATSTWYLYVQKAEGWDNIGVVRYNKPNYMSGVTIQWTDVLVTSIPSDATLATLSSTSSSITVDSALSSTSTNPVQNKVIYNNLTSLSSSIGTKYGYGSVPTFGNSLKLGTGSQSGYIGISSNVLTVRAPGGYMSGAGLDFMSCASGIYPEASATLEGNMCLGSPSRKFGTIYSIASALNSDAKLKKDVDNLSNHKDAIFQAFDNLNFVRFRWAQNMNGGIVDPPSSRYHFGLIAQPVEEVLKESGLFGGDSGIMQTNFFADNTTGAWITGGYQPHKEGYDYSENVWNYKHDLEYEWINEVIEKDLALFNSTGGYNIRPNIQYIMFEDISKVSADGKQPPLKINSITLVNNDDEYIKLELTENGVSYYDHDNDTELTIPLSNATLNDDGSLTINFNKMWASYMLKVPTFVFADYKNIILDVDYIGEYKCYLIPEGEYKNANVWDRDNNDQILYDYSLNYNEIYTLCLYALQETRKEFLDYKEQTSKEIAELKALIQKGSE